MTMESRAADSQPLPEAGDGGLLTMRSSAVEKVYLFRSLFQGRSDVFPLRFESRRTGRSGYQPACGNEWVPGVCEKPRIKCFDCPNRRFLEVTDQRIHWHLAGRNDAGRDFVMGVYPMLLDETCRLLAVDFDRESWQEDSLAFAETCHGFGMPVALERSRSGHGAHVWFFFSGAVPAVVARQMGSFLLTETMERRPDIGLRSYDRLFPNQDTLPKGGFGNLIALPLQGRAREQGNSVFIDGNLNPIDDQWAFLSELGTMTPERVAEFAEEASQRGRVIGVRFVSPDEDDPEPWSRPPSRRRSDPPIECEVPKQIEVVLSDQIYIPKQDLPAPLQNRIVRLAAFQNPEFYRAQAMRLPIYDKPRVIACAEDHSQHLGLPRGCLEDLRAWLKEHKVRLRIRDERFEGHPLHVSFQGSLRPDQQAAAEAMLEHEIGVLAATTAFGKTVLAAWMIAQRGVNTLVLVHRQQLLEQWVERLSEFLGVTPKEIGRLGGGRKRLTGSLDVALIQSLVRKGAVDDRVADYGHLVVDECHHLSARSFELAARRAKAKFVLGLSATVTRKDGHHPIIFMQCGPVRHRVDARRQAALRPFSHQVIVRPTAFRSGNPPDPDQRIEFQRLYDELISSERRNRLICEDVLAVAADGRFPIILTERTRHLEELAELLRPRVDHLVTLRGGMGRKALANALDQLKHAPANESRLVIATGRFVGEGFDDARLDTLFLTLPVSWRGTIAQYVGRLHRLHRDKKEVRVFDYADLDVPMLARMFDRRCAGYEAVGYTILLPASALPGWPADVPLPIDPVWKRDYAASVQRLIRDGVDVPLAHLFLHATDPPAPGAAGVARARSASEAFLFRRLEGLHETTGRFELNVRLAIPFDDCSSMEVDFLCRDLKLVLELDGPQHFLDADAYRRDRRKDALLQERGYFVLRFLTQEIVLHLDEVLDRIHRTLSHLSGSK